MKEVFIGVVELGIVVHVQDSETAEEFWKKLEDFLRGCEEVKGVEFKTKGGNYCKK